MMSVAAQAVVRVAAAVFAAAVGIAATALALQYAGERGHAFSDDPLPYLIFGALATGGTLYSAGAVVWNGGWAQVLRAAGWALMIAALMYPTTLTLALPLVAVLVITVTRIAPGADSSGRGTVTANV
jgi:hypothetical protein